MPALAKVRDDHVAMRELLLKLQKYAAVLILPVGFGVFLFSDLITEILLGPQWHEASPFIGLWALVDVVMIVFARFCSNIYPAIGRADIAVASQLLHVIVLIPAVYCAISYGFTALYWTRSLVRLEGMAVNMYFAWYLIRLSPWKMIQNVVPELIACLVMSAIACLLLSLNNSVAYSMLWGFLSFIVYLGVLYLFPYEKKVLVHVFENCSHRVTVPGKL
jgi:PST family polysaccharide transporter